MANLNTALTPAPVVTVVNKDGTTATGYTGNVTMALGTNPTNATLGGTTVVAATSGVATFSNLTLDRSGKNFTLRATAAAQGGYTPKARVSRPFSIPTRCVFTTQPTGSSAAGGTLPTFTVTIQDSAGNTDTSYTGADVTVALYTGAGSGILSGFSTRTATAGVVDFSGLSIDANGTYSFRVTAEAISTAYNPAPAVSNTFGIPGYILTAVNLGSDTYGKSISLGSISPATYAGFAIRVLQTAYVDVPDPGDDYTTTFSLQGTHSQNLFTTITVNGRTFASADATFNGVNQWEWTSQTGPLTAAGTYGVSFT